MPGKGWRGPTYHEVRKAMERGDFDRRGGKTRLAQELGVNRQRVTELAQLVDADKAEAEK